MAATPGSTDTDGLPQLTAPEYAVLLNRPWGDAAKAALTETIARGRVRVVRSRVRSGLRRRDQLLLVLAPGPADDLGPVLAPVLEALGRARTTVAVDGTAGVTPKHWYEEMKRSVSVVHYGFKVVQPELERRGLYARRKTWYRLTVSDLSPLGETVRADASRRAEQAHARLTPELRERVPAGPTDLAPPPSSGSGLDLLSLHGLEGLDDLASDDYADFDSGFGSGFGDGGSSDVGDGGAD